MDIHPPHAIRSWKDFFIQLGTITAGILIALSLEGIRESMHNRSLVTEARENIRRELQDNKREVDNELAQIAGRESKIGNALQFANELIATKKTDIRQIELQLSFPTLSVASWQTAERTGAFSHMDYAEIQKYAHAYGVQELLSQQHVRALDALAGALGILSASPGGDPTKAMPVELERFRQQVIVLRSILFVEQQITSRASEAYQEALGQLTTRHGS
jgi:plasmid stability protein